MSALADALLVAQRRALQSVEKAYVGGKLDGDAATEKLAYATTEGTLHLFGHRIGVAGIGAERGPWCPKSGARVGA